ncbi:MAG: hypothetical protein K0R82_2208, partial [Flavipsychrobacter sp.]|nr:hypothetical protein [Flavipsychrobacter sp.]
VVVFQRTGYGILQTESFLRLCTNSY